MISPGLPLTIETLPKSARLLALLWAASQPRGVSRLDACRFVAPALEPEGPHARRTLRRYINDLKRLGFDVRTVSEMSAWTGRECLARVFVHGVTFKIEAN